MTSEQARNLDWRRCGPGCSRQAYRRRRRPSRLRRQGTPVQSVSSFCPLGCDARPTRRRRAEVMRVGAVVARGRATAFDAGQQKVRGLLPSTTCRRHRRFEPRVGIKLWSAVANRCLCCVRSGIGSAPGSKGRGDGGGSQARAGAGGGARGLPRRHGLGARTCLARPPRRRRGQDRHRHQPAPRLAGDPGPRARLARRRARRGGDRARSDRAGADAGPEHGARHGQGRGAPRPGDRRQRGNRRVRRLRRRRCLLGGAAAALPGGARAATRASTSPTA